jgi:hypothetical protein
MLSEHVVSSSHPEYRTRLAVILVPSPMTARCVTKLYLSDQHLQLLRRLDNQDVPHPVLDYTANSHLYDQMGPIL